MLILYPIHHARFKFCEFLFILGGFLEEGDSSGHTNEYCKQGGSLANQKNGSPELEADPDQISAHELKKRVEKLEGVIELLLAASLRGRLLPADRKMIKRYLESKAEEKKQSGADDSAEPGPTCPVCRLPIPNENMERCPNCSVLLDVVRKYRSGE